MKSASKLYRSSLKQAKKVLGIDGEKYFESIEGQIEYIGVIQSNKINADTFDEQCGSCTKLHLKNDNYICSLFDKTRLSCPAYEDCGKKIFDRIETYVRICGSCQNSKDEEGINLICKIPTNMFDGENCKDYKEKPNETVEDFS
jgi:hypothetical protein